jgi:hypothetical protein
MRISLWLALACSDGPSVGAALAADKMSKSARKRFSELGARHAAISSDFAAFIEQVRVHSYPVHPHPPVHALCVFSRVPVACR